MGVRARLEVDVQRAAFGPIARLGESLFFGMRLAGPLVITLAREMALAIQNHSADHGVGAGVVVRLSRQGEGAGRPVHVCAALAVLFLPGGMYLSCHCNNRIRSMRFSKLPSCAGSNSCSLSLAPQ